jgi:glycosyltransferase involved in cell wall biosynthesis
VPQRGRPSGRTHDVAIYSPDAALFYGSPAAQLGGAELQTTFLARELARRGLRVAHIVYPVNPRPLEQPAPTLVERSPWQDHRYRRLGELAEAVAIWRSFRRADAEAYIVRGSGGQVPAAAGYCRAFRRRFVFSTSSELDFDFERPDRYSHVLRVYKASIPMADRVVVQTESQRLLAERSLDRLEPVVIPSFAEPAEPAAEGEHFLWANRLVEYKLPERYLELAAALPEARFKMIMGTTSETPTELIEQTRTAAAELPNLELLPARPREELLTDMHAATAVVTTSRIEGMPNTFLEAWARGVPVLSLHVDPDDKIATHGLGTVAGGSMERLIESAASLWRDPQLRREIGERARRFVRETHQPEAVGDRWAELLDDLLGGGGRAQRPK